MSAAPPVRELLLVGTPNAGKSTLFHALTGQYAEVGNFAGTTVSLHLAALTLGGRAATCADLPGTVSLAAHSPEEAIAIRALWDAARAPGRDVGVVFVADAPRLSRSLYLLVQVLELGLPVVVALNLVDEARAAGLDPRSDVLAGLLGVPVLPVVARTGDGVEALRAVLAAPWRPTPAPEVPWPAPVQEATDAVAAAWGARPGPLGAMARWALLSDARSIEAVGLPPAPVEGVRAEAATRGLDLDAAVVGARYTWVDARVPSVLGDPDAPARPRWSDALDRLLLHPLGGTLAFLGVMWTVFTALFSGADPAIAWLEDGIGALGEAVHGALLGVTADSAILEILRDLVVQGLIGGVGAVIVFVPQIALLFFFLAVLEDCGYLARAAHISDRVLRAAGLPGKAFVPLLSGYACAVPAILATRTLPRFRDRLVTMMVLPLTSCSARLPIYALLIGALFPATVPGTTWALRPLVLLGLYVASAVLAIGAAILIGRLVLPSPPDATVLELPPYRVPHPGTVLRSTWSRTREFLDEAGRVILAATLVLWALLSFPRYAPEEIVPPDVLAAAVAAGDAPAAVAAPYALRASYAGQLGHLIEPVIAPLGFDWKIGIGLIGSFAAREVFVSTMGVVYGIVDADEEDEGLREALRADRHPDGRPVFTPAVGAGIMAFFAIAMQCLSTLAVLRKETGGWRWPALATVWLTGMAWGAAFVVVRLCRALGWG